jgi:hypothetical protein
MKVKPIAIDRLKKQIAAKAAASPLSYTEIGHLSGVHASQVSRICRGVFETLSQNVVQVCSALEVDIDALIDPPQLDPIAARLTAGVLAVWDGTSGDARRIKRLLAQLKDFRDDSVREAAKAAVREVAAADGPAAGQGT